MERELQQYEQCLSGRAGDMVYYNIKGKTYIRKRPGSYNKNPTAQQAAARLHFAAAIAFARSVIADPVLKALYTKKAAGKRTAYATAISEYLKRI